MEIYEYIFAALLLVAVFAAATYLAVTALPLYRSVSGIDQLKIAAQKVMNNILLNPGYPQDWGNNVSVKAEDLASFGLASYTTLTREAYVLDQDKVQRLCREVPDPLYVPPSKVLDLLNLGLDYGIRLEFVPVLDVKVEASQGSSGLNVRVVVASEQGLPVEGANVTVVVVYARDGNLTSSKNSGRTDASGVCALSVESSPPALLITIVDYHGMRVINASTIGPGIRKSLVFGRSLVADGSTDLSSRTAYQFFISSGFGEALEVKNVSCTLQRVGSTALGNYGVYDMGFEEPNLVAAVVMIDDGQLLVAYKLVPKTYSSIAGEVHPPASYTVERSVRIGLSHYNLRLTIWRMSW